MIKIKISSFSFHLLITFLSRESHALWISIKDVFCMVNLVTPKARIYNLIEKDVPQTTNAFLSYSDQ